MFDSQAALGAVASLAEVHSSTPPKHSATPTAAAPEPPIHPLSPAERAQVGKALRNKLPRDQHAMWKRPEHPADPIDLLQAADADRVPDLVPIRYGRMLPSPFVFFRGSAGVMAADRAHTPAIGLRVQACGDCHLLNFGGFAPQVHYCL
jgi:hypothetical protein